MKSIFKSSQDYQCQSIRVFHQKPKILTPVGSSNPAKPFPMGFYLALMNFT